MDRIVKVTAISDLHGTLPKLEGGDLLIVAGDLTARDTLRQHDEFCEWLDVQGYAKKVVIAGNHDGNISGDPINCLRNCIYLQDSGTEFEGIKIWGSPWTPTFCDWHFMLPRGEPINAKWVLIPEDTDILVTHGPPLGKLDKTDGERAGCYDLLKAVCRIKPRYHIFGHIHEGYGQAEFDGITYINASHMDENYNPINRPISFEYNR